MWHAVALVPTNPASPGGSRSSVLSVLDWLPNWATSGIGGTHAGTGDYQVRNPGGGLSWPGGAGLGVGQLLGNSPCLPSGDEGLGESGSRLAGKGPCPRSSDHDRGSRNSSTSPCSLWSHLQSAGPSRRPVDQLTSGRGTAGGDLRRSAPIGAKVDPTYLCPWHDGAGIRISVRYFQVQAVARREESIVSRRIGGSVSSSSTM